MSDYAGAKTLNEMREIMAKAGVKWVNLSSADKAIFKKLKDMRGAATAVKAEEIADDTSKPVEEVIEAVKSSEEAKEIAAKVKKQSTAVDYNDLKNGIMDELFKKNLDGRFRSNLRRMIKTSIAKKEELIKMLHELIDLARSGTDKGEIRKFIKKIDA